MSKFVKQFTMPTPHGSLAERVAKTVKDAEVEHGKPMQLMRSWIKAGYILDHFGHGLMEALIAMVEEDRTKGMSQKEMAGVLKSLIDRTYWIDSVSDDSQTANESPIEVGKDSISNDKGSPSLDKKEPKKMQPKLYDLTS